MIEHGRLATALAFFATLVVPAPLLAHGGVFPPPPPFHRPPPASPTPEPRPQPVGPSAPRGREPGRRGPATPGPKGPTAPGNSSGGPSTGLSSGPEATDWSWWWTFNEDPYIDLRRRVQAGSSLTGFEDFYIGQGMRPQAASLSPGGALIQERVGPALAAAFDGDGSARLRAAALVALAKLHPGFEPAEGTPVSRALLGLQDSDRDVVRAAILALALVADTEAVLVLGELLEGGDAAARRLGRSSVPEVFRVQAALGAGLAAFRSENEELRRYLVHRLGRVLSEERFAAPDMHIACVTAIGLAPLRELPAPEEDHEPDYEIGRGERVPPPSASRFGQVQLLTSILEDDKASEFVRAHVPKALALLVREAREPLRRHVARTLLARLEYRKERRLVRYGLVEALGVVGDADADELDLALRAALRKVVKDGDVLERHLALLSLAFVSSRPGRGLGEPLEGLRAEQVWLMKQFVQAKDRTRPWAALALGLQGYHARAAGGTLFDSTGKGLRWTFERTRAASSAAAFALALGLRRDTQAIPLLLARLDEVKDDSERGRVAIGLGLVGAREAIEPLSEVVRESDYRPQLLHDAAVALALLGHSPVTDDLLETLVEAKSSAVRAAAVSAIGFVGDVRAVEPLIAILEGGEGTDALRTNAAEALGIVCEAETLPWSASFTNRMNYTARTETLLSANRTGFLDQR